MAAVEFSLLALASDPNLIAYWKAEDVNATTGGFTLTNTNSVTFTAAKFNNGFNFGSSNTNKDVRISNNLGLNTYQAGVFTWSAWVNITTAPGTNAVFELFYLNNNTKTQLELWYSDVSGVKKLRYVNYNGLGAELLDVNQEFTIGTWYHVALLKNGTALSFWVNGVNISSQTITIADNSPARADKYSMGAEVFTPGNYLSGLVDDVAIFNRALTPTEIGTITGVSQVSTKNVIKNQAVNRSNTY